VHYLPPIGQDMRLTIVSTDVNDSANTPDAGASDLPLSAIRPYRAADADGESVAARRQR